MRPEPAAGARPTGGPKRKPLKRESRLTTRKPLKASRVQMKQGRALPAQSKRTKAARPARRRAKAEVIARDETCQLLGLVPGHACWGGPSFGHLQKASGGGGYTVENGQLQCVGGNGWIEDHPLEAAKYGLVRRVPVKLLRYQVEEEAHG